MEEEKMKKGEKHKKTIRSSHSAEEPNRTSQADSQTEFAAWNEANK